MSGLTQVLGSYQKRTHVIKNITWRLFPKVSDLNLIFVVGAPRSGTTLMHRILACHSELFAINQETGFFSMRNYFNLDHFALGDSSWPSVVDQASGPGDYFKRSIDCVRRNQEIQDGIFVEKTPQNVMRLKHLLRIFPSAKVIHVVRDGRDCYRSSKSHPNIPQRKNAQTFARYWTRCLNARQNCGEDSRIHDVRYEDLAENPQEELSAVMAFLGQRLEAAQLDPSSLSSDRRSSREVFARLKEPISAKTVGLWKQALTHDEVTTFENIAGQQLIRWGFK